MNFKTFIRHAKKVFRAIEKDVNRWERQQRREQRASRPSGRNYKSGHSIPERRNFGHAFKAHLYSVQNGHCNGCGSKFPMARLEMDHYVPLAAGGDDTHDNMQLLCKTCNRTKGGRRLTNDDLYNIAWN